METNAKYKTVKMTHLVLEQKEVLKHKENIN